MKAARKIVSSRGWHGETLWIAKSVISPRLWESDKTLCPLSFHSSYIQSPLIHLSFTLCSPSCFFIYRISPSFPLPFVFFFVFLYPLPRPHFVSFLFVYILAPGSCSANHVYSLQHTCITAMEMIAFLNNKGNVTRLVLFPIPFPLPAWREDGQHSEGGL